MTDEGEGIYGTAIPPNITWMRKYAGTTQRLDYNGETYIVEIKTQSQRIGDVEVTTDDEQ
ncbi:hypothetical protein PN419_00110 [Halorubrum ezzemoulense]|uniref:hypothetical protein n=1 Tax=Halorubrum ezzemoulense TaxID=337243 RepID=UPI00232B79E2|nr:hypothetical protein [Halorubrum ezzemoulense]MDB9247410.1 hypothetical protein [Halorubrum ezzemoulense]MDB9258681.1 hypothetical protein [Halorubrum ezzemoulense]MDB9264461.1 hypothetical protein [Halorubrum ezzemoulense]MDB9269042.1 hypothetical protein [Halorubrum ezzemoulense]MDB9271429.1 hypothetical protein [Halorubrum ezzemoulense]